MVVTHENRAPVWQKDMSDQLGQRLRLQCQAEECGRNKLHKKAIRQMAHINFAGQEYAGSDTMLNRHGQGEQIGKQ